MNTIEYVLKLKDMMSGGMQRVASTARGALQTVDNSFARTQSRANTMTMSIRQMNDRLNQLKQTREISIHTRQIQAANREIQELERRIARAEGRYTGSGSGALGGRSSRGGSMLSMAGMVRGLLPGLSVAGAGALVGSSINTAMNIQAQQTSFRAMAGYRAGNQLFNGLRSYARNSIYGNEVYQMAQTQLGFGAQASEVLPTIKMLGDIAMGNKERFQALNLAYSQIRANGRLMGQDLWQLVNAGFNPLQVISEKTGRSMAQLKKDMEQGSISFDMVQQAFETATSAGGRFNGMTDKLSTTAFGKWQAFKGQVESLSARFGEALLPTAGKVIDLLAAGGNMISPFIEQFNQFINSPATGAYLNEMASNVRAVITALKPVGAAIAPIFRALGPALAQISRTISGNMVEVWKAWAPALENVGTILSGLLVPAIREATFLLSKLSDAATWVQKKLGGIWEFTTGIAKSVYGIINGALDIITSKTTTAWDTLKETVSQPEAFAFFKKIGELHGQNYVNGLLQQYAMVAQFMDRLYGNRFGKNYFTNLYNDIVSTYQANSMAAVVVRPTSGGMNSGGGGDLAGLSGSADRVTSGGVRAVNITVGKFFENFIVRTQTVESGLDTLQDKVEDALYRILESGNRILDR